ncbi:MAG: hypothetical protein WD010_11235 [Nitriliruptor sp.]|uniref:hypothetical protein n=1 Tax=Nitriliruptor sp. TaxID=2448056 RepID=UPI00349FD481
MAWPVGLATAVLIASGREAGAAWVVTGLLLSVVVAGLVELTLARAQTDTKWVVAFVIVPPLALIAWAMRTLERPTETER